MEAIKERTENGNDEKESVQWVKKMDKQFYRKIIFENLFTYPKTEILGCDKTIPLEQNLIPRFVKSRGKQKGQDREVPIKMK